MVAETRYLPLLLVIVVTSFLTLKLYTTISSVPNKDFLGLIQERNELSRTLNSKDLLELIQERNELSRTLNDKQKLIGQLECEKVANKPKASSSTGGYCHYSSIIQKAGSHRTTDKGIIPILAELFKGKSVASFGDGPGVYKQLLLETGKLKSYESYDGAPYAENISDGRVLFLDLALPQYGLPIYDWILSLEVAEHIPRQYETVFIDNIARHAKEGVVLSWAVPGQGGHLHVNNRPFEYVLSLMEKFGFKHNVVESEKIKTAATISWLRQNTNVYMRQNLSSIQDMYLYA